MTDAAQPLSVQVLVTLIPVIVGGLLGAVLGHVYRLRGESVRALSEARTEWLSYRFAEMWEYVQESSLRDQDDPPGRMDAAVTMGELSTLDPVGAASAEQMIQLHSLALAANAWLRRHDPLPGPQLVFAPQVADRTEHLQHHLALWALVSWRMPTWRLRLIYRVRQLPIELKWIIDEELLNAWNLEKAIAKRDRKVFRERGY